MGVNILYSSSECVSSFNVVFVCPGTRQVVLCLLNPV